MSRLLAPLLAGALLAVALLAPIPAAVLAQTTTEPALGDAVTFLRDPAAGPDGGTVSITVVQVVDPFAAFGAASPPPNTRLVFVSLTVANASDSPLAFDPTTLFLLDADGLLSRPIDLQASASGTIAADQSRSVAPGAALDGGVLFAVAENAVLARLFHDPAPDRLILLANLAAAPAASRATSTPGPDAIDLTPAANGDGAIDCAGFAAYHEETKARLDRLEGFADDLDGVINTLLVDPTGAGAAIDNLIAELDQFADEQRAAAVPAGAEPLNDQIVAMYERYAEGFRQMADGLATLDPTALQAAIPIVSDADDLNQQVLADLAAAAESCGLTTD